MGIDVCVIDSNYQTVDKDHFVNNGFPSNNLRHFGILAWIPKFNDLVGEDDIVDKYAWEMKSTTHDVLHNWYNHILEAGRTDEIMAKYIKHCIDNNFTLVFWG